MPKAERSRGRIKNFRWDAKQQKGDKEEGEAYGKGAGDETFNRYSQGTAILHQGHSKIIRRKKRTSPLGGGKWG